MNARTPRLVLGRSDAQDTLSAQLVRTGTGDASAFAEVYDATAARVYGVALRVVRDAHQAEEVAQEAFLEIWRKAARFDPARGSASGWITTIAHRRAVDHVRSSQSTRRTDDRWHHDAVETTAADSTFDLAQARLGARSVVEAVAALPAAQRRAVELAYFDGHTYSDVSTLMQVPLGTTKTRIRTALARLRHQLELTQVETA